MYFFLGAGASLRRAPTTRVFMTFWSKRRNRLLSYHRHLSNNHQAQLFCYKSVFSKNMKNSEDDLRHWIVQIIAKKSQYNDSHLAFSLKNFFKRPFTSAMQSPSCFSFCRVMNLTSIQWGCALWEKTDENCAAAFVYNYFKLAGPKISTYCGSLRFMGLWPLNSTWNSE